AAQLVADQEVEAVITANAGPRAFDVFNQLDIKVYQAEGKIKEVIHQFIDGKLEEISTPTGPQHMGMPKDASQKDKKSERIFFPLLDNNGEDSKISEHFGHAPFFGLYDTETKKLTITENDLDHTDPTKSPIDQIQEAVNPTTIFAKGIGGRAIQFIAEKGMSLKTGDYETVKQAIENLDKLKDLTEGCGH
ncbi:hypothetical protein GOV06_05940, partial [Candidatus Woesearchaeota archaeon]|nr:hypothetical protein [Candidatus Woesearchaeota archaeon]